MRPAARWAVLLGLAGLAALVGVPAAFAALSSDAGSSPRLVVVGAPGLAWSDLDRADLPTLGAMSREGALGSMTVRAVRSGMRRPRGRVVSPIRSRSST